MGLRLGFLLLYIFFGVGFIILSLFHYKNKFKNSYNLRNMFPYEVNYESHFLDNGWGNIAMILSTAMLIAYFATFHIGSGMPIFYPINFIGGITALIIPFIILVPLKYLKAHIGLIVAQFATAICLPASIAISALRLYQDYEGGTLAVVVLVCSLLVAVFVLMLALNPKLSLRIKADESKNENGETVYTRPKFIPLAFTEWLLIFTVCIDAILVFVMMLFNH